MVNKSKTSIIPKKGERALLVGSTGCGKTAFACFLLERLESVPIIIYDTKEDDKFLTLPNSVVVTNNDQLDELINDPEIDYYIYRPELEVTVDPNALDELLLYHYNKYHNTVAYIDEAYQFHKSGRCGQGLLGLLTRGRSRGITTIISTQRPSYISRFCISESQNFFIFRLNDLPDKKRIGEFVPDYIDLPSAPDFGFYYYSVNSNVAQMYQPIKLDSKMNKGYFDTPTNNPINDVLENVVLPKKNLWI